MLFLYLLARFKKRKKWLVAELAWMYINRAHKNSNITILETILMLLWQYPTIFKTSPYVMPKAYSRPCQISIMMKHIENLGIVRTVYSGIFGDIQQYLAGFRPIFRDFQVYCGTLRHIKALLWQIEQYLGRFRTLRNPCIHNRAHTCIYSEP